MDKLCLTMFIIAFIGGLADIIVLSILIIKKLKGDGKNE